MIYPVTDPLICALIYDCDEYELQVRFHTNADHTHSGVPEAVIRSLMNSTSKSAYYNRNIRGKFPCSAR